jgi:hypothetical protein
MLIANLDDGAREPVIAFGHEGRGIEARRACALAAWPTRRSALPFIGSSPPTSGPG